MRKGIILSGGSGTRLYPLTQVCSKQLQAVYDKPMVYYPLSTLMLSGLREFCVISTPQDIPLYESLLGSGEPWGVKFTYKAQPEPKGIAQAFLVAEEFIGDDPVSLILGDNIFYGHFGDTLTNLFQRFECGAQIFAYRVHDPERYGVIEFDDEGRAISIEEKPEHPKTHFAIPGLYLYDNRVVEICKGLKPSARGELEITDVNRAYLDTGELRVSQLGRGTAWLDTGTIASLQEASSFVSIIENRQGTKIGCPEEIALRRGFISLEQFETVVNAMPECEYSSYLRGIIEEF